MPHFLSASMRASAMARAVGNAWKRRPPCSRCWPKRSTSRPTMATPESRLTCWKGTTFANASNNSANRGGRMPRSASAVGRTLLPDLDQVRRPALQHAHGRFEVQRRPGGEPPVHDVLAGVGDTRAPHLGEGCHVVWGRARRASDVLDVDPAGGERISDE